MGWAYRMGRIEPDRELHKYVCQRCALTATYRARATRDGQEITAHFCTNHAASFAAAHALAFPPGFWTEPTNAP